ncbi:MAG: PQQ-binding-like beta-propeller repeat protein [Dissulfuribacterales bacterium]
MAKTSTRFNLAFIYILFHFFLFLLLPDTPSAKTVTMYAEPASGIAPLEVKLHCFVDLGSSGPVAYKMKYGDGSDDETIDSTEYQYTFTHIYTEGYFKPVCSVQKELGSTGTSSEPAYIIVAKWKFETDGDVDSSPAVGPDGTVYVGSDDKNLYAINPDTGEELWRFPTDGEIRSSPAIGTDGTIYFGSQDYHFYAVKPSGELKWEFNVGDYIFSSPAISADGRTIYFGSSDNSVYALNSSGTRIKRIKWKYKTNGKIVSSPVIGYDGVGPVIYFGSLDRHVYALAANDGSLNWKFATKAEIYGSPVIDSKGKIYVGECKTVHAADYNFMLYCINVDGSEYWQFNGGTGFYSSPAIDEDGKIYIGAWDGYLVSIWPNGKLNWSVRTAPPSDINSSPAVGSNGVIYVGSKDGNFYAFQTPEIKEKLQREEWVFKTGDDIFSSPVIDEDGTIFFGSRDYCVYAINPGNMHSSDSPWPMFRASADHSGVQNTIKIPDVISSFPVNNSIDIDINTKQVSANFSPTVERDQIDIDSFKLEKNTVEGREDIEGSATLKLIRYNNSAHNLSAIFERLHPDEPLNYNTSYFASIDYTEKKSTEDASNTEAVFEKTFSWSFTTEAEPEKDPGSGSGGSPGCFISTMKSRY